MKINEKYDIINPNHYLDIISKNNSTEEEDKDIKKFEEFVDNYLMKYEDYLLDDQRMFLSVHKRNMNNLLYSEQNNPNNQLNNKQQHAIEQYTKSMEDAKKIGLEKRRVLQRKNNNASLGYVNAFIVILSMLAAGIIIGITLFSAVIK